MTRWIVDTDGSGHFRVAEDSTEGARFLCEAQPLEKCERLIKRLREGDAARLHARRVEQGHRLARRRHD